MNPCAQVPSSIIEENIKKTLSNHAMKGNWDEVISIYEQQGEIAHVARVTRSGDTAIHIAISEELELVVERLVECASTTPSSLAIKNEFGETPLHLAASLGNIRTCKCIADQDPKLIGIRNKDSETPFFLAVHHGRKNVFFCLHSFLTNGQGYEYPRRNGDGQTILHSAIVRGYFDIAFQIIHQYPKLLDSVNEHGFSPLHLLASESSFQGIFVDELKLESHYHTLSEELQCGDYQKTYPENYQTCAGLVRLLREMKEKHTWSVQIMEKLLEHSSLYEYEDTGRRPHLLALVEDGTVAFDPESLIEPPTVHDDHNHETPILIAAKNGITEIVERILELFPEAIHDVDNERRNIVLLAVENRHSHVYESLPRLKTKKEVIF